MSDLIVLAVDDDPDYLGLLTHAIERAGAGAIPCASLEELHGAIGRAQAVVSDYRVPTEREGEEIVRICRARAPAIPVAILSSLDRAETAVRLLRRGASDYVVKPASVDELRARVDTFLRQVELDRKANALTARASLPGQANTVLQASSALKPLFDEIVAAARTRATVLVTGESGTGKELAARAIHELSPRGAGPFVCVDCGAIPETLIENELFGHKRGAYSDARDDRQGLVGEAQGGTLFLDEIGELPLAVQAKLLRLLQAREYRRLGEAVARTADIRVVAATHRNLRVLVRAGRFRQDLYYRLDVIRLVIPPLRERREDIPLLAGAFLRRAALEQDGTAAAFSREALDALAAHGWEGNVRELENVVMSLAAFVRNPVVERSDIERVFRATAQQDSEETPAEAGSGTSNALLPYHDAKERAISSFERSYVEQLLERHDGKVGAAAREAGIDRKSLTRLLARLGLRDHRS